MSHDHQYFVPGTIDDILSPMEDNQEMPQCEMSDFAQDGKLDDTS